MDVLLSSWLTLGVFFLVLVALIALIFKPLVLHLPFGRRQEVVVDYAFIPAAGCLLLLMSMTIHFEVIYDGLAGLKKKQYK